MRWTTEKPTKPGFYWFKDGDRVDIMRLHQDAMWLAEVFGLDRKWSSEPLEEPEE